MTGAATPVFSMGRYRVMDYGRASALVLERRNDAYQWVDIGPFATLLEAKRAMFACPTCKRQNVLSLSEARNGYQCLDCTRRDES